MIDIMEDTDYRKLKERFNARYGSDKVDVDLVTTVVKDEEGLDVVYYTLLIKIEGFVQ